MAVLIEDTDDEIESFESMKEEALDRMTMLGLKPEIYGSYKYDCKLLCSDDGKLTEVPEIVKKEIEEWENKYNNIVYHVIHSNYIYETYECLSVSCYKEDWEFERDLIESGWVMSHSINKSVPEYTESGSIRVVNKDGILRRNG